MEWNLAEVDLGEGLNCLYIRLTWDTKEDHKEKQMSVINVDISADMTIDMMITWRVSV